MLKLWQVINLWWYRMNTFLYCLLSIWPWCRRASWIGLNLQVLLAQTYLSFSLPFSRGPEVEGAVPCKPYNILNLFFLHTSKAFTQQNDLSGTLHPRRPFFQPSSFLLGHLVRKWKKCKWETNHRSTCCVPLKTWKMNRLTGHNGVVTKIYRVHFKITWPFVDVFMGRAVKLNKRKELSYKLYSNSASNLRQALLLLGLLYWCFIVACFSVVYFKLRRSTPNENKTTLIIKVSRLFGQPWQRRLWSQPAGEDGVPLS